MAACGWSGWALGVADHGPAALSAFTFALIGMVVGLALQSLLQPLARRVFPGWWARVDVEPVELGTAKLHATTIEGAVLGPVAEPLRSPLDRVEAVAVRLVGAVGSVMIDDAAVVGFAIETDAGARVLVDPAHVVVALDPGESVRVADPSAGLESFLAERGIAWADAPARLAEGVLRAGDRVRIDGTPVERADPHGAGGGMREAPVARAFQGSLDRPVIVRRC
jgi:hypothetical protein